MVVEKVDVDKAAIEHVSAVLKHIGRELGADIKIGRNEPIMVPESGSSIYLLHQSKKMVGKTLQL